MGKLRKVEVIWKDITGRPGWHEQDDVDVFVMDKDENIVYQVGYLYEEDEEQVCLVNSYFEDKDLLGDVTKIPRGVVVSIKYLDNDSLA